MKILIAFNNYADIPTGGEKNVVLAEEKLLRAHGHEVLIWERGNAEIRDLGFGDRLAALKNSTWSKTLKADAGKVLDQFKPDIFHLHNFWMRMTPSVFEAAHERSIPTVHTLHNFRMICPGTQLMYRERPCEDCLRDGRFSRCLIRHCFLGGSRLKTFLSYRLYREIRRRRFLAAEVDAFIALTEFSRRKFIQGGLDPKKIFVKPNFLEDPLPDVPAVSEKPGALFIGRLSAEKGIGQLLDAWNQIDYPLTITGQGALENSLRARNVPGITFTGGLPRAEVLRRLAECSFLVFPSVWYETFGLTLIEAMALGKPILASNLGGRPDIIQDGVQGVLYDPFKLGALEEGIRRMIRMTPEERHQMGRAGRERYLRDFTPEVNYRQLIEIYQKAMATRA
ncbi:MAG: glycosyltransferase family 4 protein [Verrucomicrobia bacterium]|nr:glycosyltransferase family 4 protein [Verrucomicrobiota bacterium]